MYAVEKTQIVSAWSARVPAHRRHPSRERHSRAISRWGTAVIETSDGIRDGTFPGAGTSATIDIITWWLSGTEDCE